MPTPALTCFLLRVFAHRSGVTGTSLEIQLPGAGLQGLGGGRGEIVKTGQNLLIKYRFIP